MSGCQQTVFFAFITLQRFVLLFTQNCYWSLMQIKKTEIMQLFYWAEIEMHVSVSSNFITPTFTGTFPWGKMWTQIMKSRMRMVTNHDIVKFWWKSQTQITKVVDTKPSRHVEMFATKSVTSLRQTCLRRSNGI